jgi:hypothetical protein
MGEREGVIGRDMGEREGVIGRDMGEREGVREINPFTQRVV